MSSVLDEKKNEEENEANESTNEGMMRKIQMSKIYAQHNEKEKNIESQHLSIDKREGKRKKYPSSNSTMEKNRIRFFVLH